MIKSEILADSINEQGDRLTTFKVVFPRYILAEVNTHRAFSRNSASSRAIPFKKMVKMVQENPFIPIAFQANHKGMQGTDYLSGKSTQGARKEWLNARDSAITHATNLSQGLEVTKQLANRIIEPYMWHTVIITSSEEGLENFFNLRCPQYDVGDGALHKSQSDAETCMIGDFTGNTVDWLKMNKGQADIHIMALAEAMWDSRNESTPKKLQSGQWHIPFGDQIYETKLSLAVSNRIPFSEAEESDSRYEIIMNEARCKIAVARCARLSYQTLGENPTIDYEKDLKLYDILSKSGHWSPMEHVCRAMSDDEYATNIRGVIGEGEHDSHVLTIDSSSGWCRNLRGFIQLRSIID